MSKKLIDKLLEAGTQKSYVLSESEFFNEKSFVPTALPILNIAFSGSPVGGFTSGLTILAGESRSFKTLLGLYCLKAYQDFYPDSISLFYDSEFGSPPSYLTSFGIDPTRIIHVPVKTIENMKFDIVQRFEQIERGDRVFIFLDSLGALSSNKEVEDAQDAKAVVDMTRAKAIKSLLRVITPDLVIKDIPCIIINHIYKTMDFIGKSVVSGGQQPILSADQVFIITKAQEKGSDGKLKGFTFTINIEKSRYVKEKAKFPIYVEYGDGIEKYSGIVDLLEEFKYIVKDKLSFKFVDPETGEIGEEKFKPKQLPEEMVNIILSNEKFIKQVESKYLIRKGV